MSKIREPLPEREKPRVTGKPVTRGAQAVRRPLQTPCEKTIAAIKEFTEMARKQQDEDEAPVSPDTWLPKHTDEDDLFADTDIPDDQSMIGYRSRSGRGRRR
jgi:hypothetical protein